MFRAKTWAGMAWAILAVASVLVVGAPARAQSWGTIKGQVVWGGGAVPKPEEAKVDKDTGHCLSKGTIYKNDLVINAKNKGVRWVLVWLTDPKTPKNAAFVPPIHPSLKAVKKDLEIDQPCCVFEPRVIALREGQKLIVKNTAPITHNFKIDIPGGPSENPLIPSGGKAEISGFKARPFPSEYNCSIHGWMKGWVATFPHPYYAVTDADGNFEIKNAPTGKFRLMVWQEKAGWVFFDTKTNDRGKVIDVKSGTNDLGKIPLTLRD